MTPSEASEGGGNGIWKPWTVVTLLLGFWALWWSLVFTTNFFDGLVQLGALGEGWSFASGNYAFLLDVTGVHDTPEFAVALIFAGGVAWELAVAALTWLAFVAQIRGSASHRHVYRAFVPAIGFFAAFLVLTEFFIAYDLADALVQLFVAVLVSLLAIDYLKSKDD